MKIKIITDSEELEKFTSREDITINKIDIRSCEQSFFAQQWFVAVVMYEENTDDNFDWQSFRAEAAKDILCVVFDKAISCGDLSSIKQYPELIRESIVISDELIRQLKGKEEK